MPPRPQDSVAVGHEVRIVEYMFSNQGGIAGVGSKNSDTVFENLSEQRFAGGPKINQINGPANPLSDFSDQCDLIGRCKRPPGVYGEIDITLPMFSVFGERTEQDREFNSGQILEGFGKGRLQTRFRMTHRVILASAMFQRHTEMSMALTNRSSLKSISWSHLPFVCARVMSCSRRLKLRAV